MKRIPPQAMLSALERRHAAIHEAGHVVIGHHVGCELVGCNIDSRIIRNESWVHGERTWHGEVNFSAINRMDDLQVRMIGCAGNAALYCWIGKDVDPDLWTNPRSFDSMSLTDWKMTGCEPRKPDRLCVVAINRLGPLLSRGGPLWRDLLRQARQLIIDARGSDTTTAACTSLT